MGTSVGISHTMKHLEKVEKYYHYKGKWHKKPKPKQTKKASRKQKIPHNLKKEMKVLCAHWFSPTGMKTWCWSVVAPQTEWKKSEYVIEGLIAGLRDLCPWSEKRKKATSSS